MATGIAAWERPVEGAHGRYTPAKVIASEDAIGYAAIAAGVPRLGKARIGVRVWLAEGTRGDVDNRIKTVLDGLQRAQRISNDNQVDDLHVTRDLPPRASPVVLVFTLPRVARPGEPPEERPTAATRALPKTESPSRVLPGL